MAGGLLDRAGEKSGNDEVPAPITAEPAAPATSSGGLAARAGALGVEPVLEGRPSEGDTVPPPAADGIPVAAWLGIFAVGILVAMAAAYRVDLLTGWVALAGMIVATVAGWRGWVSSGLGEPGRHQPVIVGVVVVLLTAGPYLANFEVGGDTIAIGEFEISEASDELSFKYDLPGGFGSASNAPLTIVVEFNGNEVHTRQITPTGDSGTIDIALSDIYQGNSLDGDDYVVSISQEGATSEERVPANLLIRTLNTADGELGAVTDTATGDFLGVQMSVSLGWRDPGTVGLLAMSSDYVFTASIQYGGSDGTGWNDAFAYPQVTVDGRDADWRGRSQSGGMGSGSGMLADTGAILLDGDDEDSFLGFYIDDDEFDAGDGCYRISVDLDHDDPFGIGGDDTFTSASTTAWRLDRSGGGAPWVVANDCGN